MSSDIDLIPEAYRTRRWQVRWLKRMGLLAGGLSGALFLSWALIGVAITKAKADVETLQTRQSTAAQQNADIQRMSAEKIELERQYRLLTNLRSGAAAGDMFVTIDRALTSDDVWFRDWEFQHAGVMANASVATINTGYFIVVPEGSPALGDDELRVQTQMEIRGQAVDHSALSSFVRRLFLQPEIDDIRIRRTSLSDRHRADTVDFELDILLNTDVRVQ